MPLTTMRNCPGRSYKPGQFWWNLACPHPYPHPTQDLRCRSYTEIVVAVLSHFAFGLRSAIFSILRRNSQAPWMSVKVELDFLDPKGSSSLGVIFSGPFPLQVIAKGIALRHVSGQGPFPSDCCGLRTALRPVTRLLGAWALPLLNGRHSPPSPQFNLIHVPVSSQPSSHPEVA